jgi:cytosine/adenosine deaminase-related metal-dependent hydrolase
MDNTDTAWVVLAADDNGIAARVAGHTVEKIGPSAEIVSQKASVSDAAGRILDCSGALLGSGDVNAHTHIYSGLAPLSMPAPEPPPENFVQILERVWWRLDRALDTKTLRASARYYIAHALLSGTTCLIDHHESPELIDGSLSILADACQELGMRAVLCYGATERNGDRDEAQRGLAECRRFIEQNERPLVRGMIGLHASFTVSDETIREAGQLARELDVPIHIHLAEDAADVADAQKRGYSSPLERLQTLDCLPEQSVLAHGVHLTAEQVDTLATRPLWLVQNPRSNRGNKVGYPRHLHRSDRVALGTDGYPSRMNDEQLALMELAIVQRERLCDVTRRAERGRDLAAERFATPLGFFEGARADVGAFFTEPVAASHQTAHSREVRVKHLLVDGQLVVEDGNLLTADIEQIDRQAQAAAPELWDKMRALA